MSASSSVPYSVINTKRTAKDTKMVAATRILQALIIAALLSSPAAHAADNSIVIALEEGKQVATFKIGDSSCALKDDQIRCAPSASR